MSNRHRIRQAGATSALPEDRESRKAEHRRVRRGVHQALHVATVDGDTDDLALALPHPTHGYTDEFDQPLSNEVAQPRNRLRHWKQSFWKRRNNERRRRNMVYETLA